MKITVDTRANTIRFALASSRPITHIRSVPAVLDVGEGGRLIGVDVDHPGVALPADDEPAASLDPTTGALYLALEEPTDRHVRSAHVAVDLATDAGGVLAALIVPRRGEGYEITYPSGNR
ncbi:MAG: DUF2283 domain-containing protein [Thermomicrobiales bacterium]